MSSPLSDEILNFCESEFFPNVQNSEVASSSNCCSYEEQSSHSNNLEIKFNNTIEKNEEANFTTVTSNIINPSRTNKNNDDNNNINNNNNDLSIIFDTQEDQIENDISASIEFTQDASFSIPHHLLHPQQDLFDINSLTNQQIKMNDVSDGSLQVQHHYPPDQPPIVPLMGPPLGHIYDDESLSSMPSYMRVNTSSSPSCPLLDPNLANYLPLNSNTTMHNAESSALLAAAAATPGGGLFFGTEFPPVQELYFQGDSGRLFCPDALPRVYNCSNELQALSNESQHLAGGTGCSNHLASDITSLDDTSYNTNVVKCTPEERREKIHRYLKKRNERNFSKKIKYACRKTLADSRPRVRGRFAKNDEFGEASTKINSCGTHEDVTNEDVKLNFTYHQDPNMITPSGHENNVNVTHNGRIFTSNCHSSSSPYDICPPLYCTDGQLH
ncbi:hypothetical protein K7X08_027410 [Anisodus acutangulus]|uniref:CCT domain-containing protein n=1 Tax=Anisodus acutangulus TaxID=402998 RepID=A0A9Q1MIV9_9SOLA|nr:hypothetical protein K7X08_027410 [Anisodus acutangulus]